MSIQRFRIRNFTPFATLNHDDITSIYFEIEKATFYDGVYPVSGLVEIYSDDFVTVEHSILSTNVQSKMIVVVSVDLTGTTLDINSTYNMKTTLTFSDGDKLIQKSKVRLI